MQRLCSVAWSPSSSTPWMSILWISALAFNSSSMTGHHDMALCKSGHDGVRKDRDRLRSKLSTQTLTMESLWHTTRNIFPALQWRMKWYKMWNFLSKLRPCACITTVPTHAAHKKVLEHPNTAGKWRTFGLGGNLWTLVQSKLSEIWDVTHETWSYVKMLQQIVIDLLQRLNLPRIISPTSLCVVYLISSALWNKVG